MELYCGDCIEVMKSIPENSVDMVLCDPPYFKVINEKWDHLWRTEQDYLNWCVSWLADIYRVLRFGGTFYLFGYFRTLSLIVPRLLELGFDLRQQIIVNKGIRSVAGRATKNYKMFPNVTESVLFLTKKNIVFSRKLLRERQQELGFSSKQINEALGVKTNGGGMWSLYTGDNVCEQFPTEELWNSLQDILKFNLPYSKISQTFHPQMGLSDVWDDIDFYKEKRVHPTQKPLKLIERLLSASTNENDLVLDPFLGSGTTGVACLNLNRNFIGIEKDEHYFEVAKQRIESMKLYLTYN